MKPLVFFDGTCGLCNGFVDFLIRHDPDARLRFAALQGETARGLIPAEFRQENRLNTVIFQDEQGSLHQKSDAALLALSKLGGPWELALFLRAVPKTLRNVVYDWVAAHRYQWFGQRESCRIPSAEERGRILP